jgi:hypothetical protein
MAEPAPELALAAIARELDGVVSRDKGVNHRSDLARAFPEP